jgi:hypothetical protein
MPQMEDNTTCGVSSLNRTGRESRNTAGMLMELAFSPFVIRGI